MMTILDVEKFLNERVWYKSAYRYKDCLEVMTSFGRKNVYGVSKEEFKVLVRDLILDFIEEK